MKRLLQYFVKRVIPSAFCKKRPKDTLRFLFALEDMIIKNIDAMAIVYEGGKIHPKHRLMKYHDFFVERIKKEDTVLDIGCGIGAVANSIAKKAGCKVVGIDICKDSIEKAKSWWDGKNIVFFAGTAPADLPKQVFSVVILSNVLEHIKDRIVFLKEISEKIKPQKLLIRVPSVQRNWTIALRQEIGISYFNDPGHYIEYDEDILKDELAQAGYFITEHINRWGEIWAEAVSAL